MANQTLLLKTRHLLHEVRNYRRFEDLLSRGVVGLPPIEFRGIQLAVQSADLAPGFFETGKHVAMQRHREIQIEYVLEGRFDFVVAGRHYPLEAGLGVTIPAGIPHEWTCREGGFLLGCEIQVLGDQRVRFLESLQRGYQSRSSRIDSPVAARHLIDLLDRFASHPDDPMIVEKSRHLQVLWLLECLTSTLDLNAWRPRVRRKRLIGRQRDREICQRAVRFIQAHRDENIRSSDVARALNLSARQLHRIFMRYQQSSVSDTLRQVRMESAHAMLTEQPDLAVKEVAWACGFRNAAYFSQCFRHHYGMPPSALNRAAG